MSGMKTTTIKKLLRNRIEDWLNSVKDESLVEMIKRDVIVSGGSIASALLGEKINDYDYYFRTKETALAVAKYYVAEFEKTRPTSTKGVPITLDVRLEDRKNCKGEVENRVIIYIKSAGVISETTTEYEYYESRPEAECDTFMAGLSVYEGEQGSLEQGEAIAQDVKKKEKYRPVFLSENAITLSDRAQLVVRFYGEAAQLHVNYDYAHAMCWYDYSKHILIAPQEALESMLSKNLVYKGSLYPIASLFRLRKFIERGWRITAGQMLKIIFQVSELNLEDPAVLRDQLLGVDAAYMHQLIVALSSDKSAKIDATYVAKLIDEIFE